MSRSRILLYASAAMAAAATGGCSTHAAISSCKEFGECPTYINMNYTEANAAYSWITGVKSQNLLLTTFGGTAGWVIECDDPDELLSCTFTYSQSETEDQ